MDYASSGVDIKKEEEAISALSGVIAKTLSFREGKIGAPLTGLGHFSGLIDLGDKALAIATDGVGTKLLIAKELQRYSTVGIDLIAMNVNDIICIGATPVAFVDTISIQTPNDDLMEEIGEGLVEGARQSEIAIVGGETATVPELLEGDGDGVDLMGTAVGIVDKDKIINGQDIRPGDVVLGIESSGAHSNGFTLIRKAIKKENYYMFLEPTRIYVKPILALLEEVSPTGLVHITGTGLLNLKRLKKGVGFELDMPHPHATFDAVQHFGDVTDDEMYKTFNMGIGFMVIVKEKDADAAHKLLNRFFPTFKLGRVTEGDKVVVNLAKGGTITL